MAKIVVTQIKGMAGQPESIRLVLRALGLRHISATREHKDNNCIRGMVNKVRHLIRFELKA